jgi:hypothetical protein
MTNHTSSACERAFLGEPFHTLTVVISWLTHTLRLVQVFMSHSLDKLQGLPLCLCKIWSHVDDTKQLELPRVIYNGSSATTEAFACVPLQTCLSCKHQPASGTRLCQCEIPLMVHVTLPCKKRSNYVFWCKLYVDCVTVL